jgi:glyoxylase-like metal-dependent hydrolase (beta-lactamase superfamily II)
VRAVGLHADVVVAISRAYRTTCTLVRSGNEAFVVDSPVFPDELEILPAIAEQAGFPVVGVLATHADWDHLLARYAFPEAPLGCAETTAARLIGRPGEAQRELRDFDEEMYVERPSPLSLPGAQTLPVPGHCGIGERELELHPADGHTEDGMAVWIPWARVLVAGDYLSTLDRLEPLVEQADHVVPGHGDPIDGTRAAAILREDRAYLQALRERGAEAKLPLARRSGAQRKIHAANAAKVAT